jgi:hypothetical protein
LKNKGETKVKLNETRWEVSETRAKLSETNAKLNETIPQLIAKGLGFKQIFIASIFSVCAAANAWAGPAWAFRMQTNLLRQPQAVAETVLGPGRYLRFTCSVFEGPVLSAGLGPVPFEEFAQFRASAAGGGKPAVNVRIVVARNSGQAEALNLFAKAVEDAVATREFSVSGTEAGQSARRLMGPGKATVSVPPVTEEFPLDGAAEAIGQVLEKCPFG